MCCIHSARGPQENVDYTKVFSAFPTKSQARRALALVVMAQAAVEMMRMIDYDIEREWDAHKAR